MRGATRPPCSRPPPRRYFNPRTSCGVRLTAADAAELPEEFQSTHLMRGATGYTPLLPSMRTFQSTHLMRGATSSVRTVLSDTVKNFNPRTSCGVRLVNPRALLPGFSISIHAPHAGCDMGNADGLATVLNFNPRTSCGVRRREGTLPYRHKAISIHAPHAGCDPSIGEPSFPWAVFQSTHLMRGATAGIPVPGGLDGISIHAPHAGCDPASLGNDGDLYLFQSTHLMRGATAGALLPGQEQ